MTVHDLSVQGMSCEHCRAAIERAVGALEGVDSVTVDVAAGRVEVVGGDASQVTAAIDAAGYDVVG